jgi:hypothetical protein
MVDFSAIEQRYGLPQGYLSRVRQIESRNGQDTYNAKSGAAGDFQFMPKTAAHYGLADPYNTEAAADAAARLAADNRAVLQRGGIENPSAAQLYAAHQQGAGGYLKLAQGGGAAGDAVGQKAVAWNSGDPNMTAKDFAAKVEGLYSGSKTPQESPSGVPASPLPQPIEAAQNAPAASPGLLAGGPNLLSAMFPAPQQQQEPPPQLQAAMQRPNQKYIPLPSLYGLLG